MEVSFSCICPVIDNKFRQSSVRIRSAVTPWIHSFFDNVVTKFMINNRTDAWNTDVNLLTGAHNMIVLM